VDSGIDAPIDSGSGGDGNSCGPYTPPICGTTPCDLHTNICCLTLSLAGRCLSKDDGGTCNSATEVTIQCSDECECPTGDVCCGVRNGLTATTECQAVPTGGHCQPYPQTATTASAQFCARSAECTLGDECIYQTCTLGANLYFCGLQTQSPFNCVPFEGGAGD